MIRPLRVYDEAMRFLGEIDEYRSLSWTRRYQEPGECEIVAPARAENIALLSPGHFVYLRGEDECMILERRTIEENDECAEVTAGGFTASQLLEYRLIRGTPYKYKGLARLAFFRLFSACSPITYHGDGVEFLLDEDTAPDSPEEVEFQATYRRLLSYIKKLAQKLDAGFLVRPDFVKKTLTFETYAGRDLTASVTFSDRLDNLASVSWEENREEYRNACAVIGDAKKDDESETPEIVWGGEVNAEGLSRREIRVDGQAKREEDTSDKKYREMLKTDGEDTLKEQNREERALECETEDGTYVYGRDYRIGDIVSVKKPQWGIQDKLRLTEMTRVFEDGKERLAPVFGELIPAKIDWEDSD